MRFESAAAMLRYVQSGHDIWSPQLEQYVFLYNDSGSICYYHGIDRKEAELLETLSRSHTPQEYWCAFLGAGGHICDTPEYLKDNSRPENDFPSDEAPDYASEFCEAAYRAEWIDCDAVNHTQHP